jgi:hypothetical protein
MSNIVRQLKKGGQQWDAPAVRDAAASVLKERFNIEVDLERSNENCHPD